MSKQGPTFNNYKNKSDAWNFFTRRANGLAECKMCHKILKTSGNTSNLFSHVNRVHKINKIKGQSQEESSIPDSETKDGETGSDVTDVGDNAPPPKQFQIKESFQHMTSIQKGGRKYQEITDAILRMICKDNLPLSTVENSGFKSLLKVTAPLYKIPSRKTVTVMLDHKYEVISTLYKQKFKDYPQFGLTTDVWTESGQVQSFLGLTVHYLHEMTMTSVTIGAFPMEERHTADYLSQILKDACREWNIPLEKVIAVVTDNGANIVKACSDTFGKSKHVRCFAHTLNLVPEKSFEKSPHVKVILEKVRRIVKWFKSSVVAADELRRVQLDNGTAEGDLLKCKQDVQTRWNSTYYMIERFLDLSQIINNILLNSQSGPDMLLTSEVKVLKELKQILKPLETVTKEMSGEKYSTLGKVIPIVHGINYILEKIALKEDISIAFKNTIVEEMKRRFEQMELVDTLAVATLLDPRFKKIHFKNYNAVAKAVKLIKNEISLQTNIEVATEENSTSRPPDENDNEDVWSHHKILMEQTNPDEDDINTLISTEISQYLAAPLCHLERDPFKEWEKIKISFPKLYLVAIKYLQIPATSVPSERLFSKAGNIMTEKRNRLLGKRLNKLLFLGSLGEEDWK